MDEWRLAYDISEWVIRLAMIPVVARERSQVALGWLGAIFFAPWPRQSRTRRIVIQTSKLLSPVM